MARRPSHRLDLIAVFAVRPAADAIATLQADLKNKGIVDADYRPGPAEESAVEGGFARIRFDDPGDDTLYANQQGGFRVRCPVTQHNLVPEFQAAWRLRAPLQCPHCQREHQMAELSASPPIAVGRYAVVFADAGSRVVRPVMAEWLAALGPVRWVWRRVA